MSFRELEDANEEVAGASIDASLERLRDTARRPECFARLHELEQMMVSQPLKE